MDENSPFFVGRKQIFDLVVRSADVRTFLDLTGDHNPLHRDQSFASTTKMSTVNLAGMHVSSLVVGRVGSEFPGPGWACKSVRFDFRQPMFKDHLYQLVLEITGINHRFGLMDIGCKVTDLEQQKIALTGCIQVCSISDFR